MFSKHTMKENTPLSIFWLRRDMRLEDNAGLFHALQGPHPVLPLFIFDTDILDKLTDRQDARVQFIHDTLRSLKSQLEDLGSSLLVKVGKPEEVWQQLFQDHDIKAIYLNRDYEPYAKQRDKAIQALAEDKGATFQHYKDHVIFDRDEVVKGDGDPYVVFTPYSRVWLEKLKSQTTETEEGPQSYFLKSYPSMDHADRFLQTEPLPLPSLADIGFEASSIEIPPSSVPRSTIKQYEEKRNFPAADATTRLGIHFRFGTISIREKARRARSLSDTFLNELIWRDFYSQILDHFPHVATEPFRDKYSHIPWRNDEDEFKKWCEGKTGYPIVDAGMRQLNQTGFMHNRVRMIVASFLTKHLLIDWRWGEAYFAEKLLDFDLASNNGGWQWAAGTGTDAAPYFRIFNPESQTKKFDKDKRYIRQYVPEYGTPAYPKPIVDHKYARERCLDAYKKGLAKADAAAD